MRSALNIGPLTTQPHTSAIQADLGLLGVRLVHWPVEEGNSHVGELVHGFDGGHDSECLGECYRQNASGYLDLQN